MLNRMAKKRQKFETPQKPSEDVFDLAQEYEDVKTPDQRNHFRMSRYETYQTFEGRFSTPLENTKRHSLDPSYISPYNQYSFSSSEAMWKLRMKASDSKVPFDNRNSGDKNSSVSPIRLKDDLINIESIKKQIKARQVSNKSAGKITSISNADLRSERQISDPKKLLDEFMLPHATIMACSKNKKPEHTFTNWRKKVKAVAAKRQKEMLQKTPQPTKSKQ